MGEGQAVDVALLDFRQAFDTVPHSVLLDKLSDGEMSRCTLRWVKQQPVDMRKHFLTERVVNHWNRRPREVVDAPCLSAP